LIVSSTKLKANASVSLTTISTKATKQSKGAGRKEENVVKDERA
jgi:hypothetical protein